MVAVEVGEALLVGALDPVVELLGDAFFDLGDHLGRVEAVEAGGQQGAEQVGVAQVGRDRLADAGVLDLHRDCAFAAVGRVAPDGAVDLADRRRGDRLGIPLDEQLIGTGAELGLHHPGRQRSALGGALAWSSARAIRTGSGSPSSR